MAGIHSYSLFIQSTSNFEWLFVSVCIFGLLLEYCYFWNKSNTHIFTTKWQCKQNFSCADLFLKYGNMKIFPRKWQLILLLSARRLASSKSVRCSNKTIYKEIIRNIVRSVTFSSIFHIHWKSFSIIQPSILGI